MLTLEGQRAMMVGDFQMCLGTFYDGGGESKLN